MPTRTDQAFLDGFVISPDVPAVLQHRECGETLLALSLASGVNDLVEAAVRHMGNCSSQH